MNSAANYRILAESAITNVPTSAITGNVGLSPATGAGLGIACVEITGVVQAGNIGGLNLGPAVYKWSTAVLIPSTLTLTGRLNDVWIFQIAKGLAISSGVQIVLAGGVLPANIYWQVFSAADLGTTSTFKGTIISSTSIVMKTGALINGRLLAGTAVNLDQNTVAP